MLPRLEVRKKLVENMVRKEDIEAGYHFFFERSENMKGTIDRFIQMEQECCTFLRFETKIQRKYLKLVITTRRLDRIEYDKDFIVNGLLTRDVLD